MISKLLAWPVSLLGWLMIPTLIGGFFATRQGVEQERSHLELLAWRCGERAGLKGPALVNYVNKIMGAIDDLSS